MPRNLIRVRQRNQVTIPKNVSESLAVEEGDLLEVISAMGDLVLRPVRLPVRGTPEAEQAIQRAEYEIAHGRGRRFDRVEDLLAHLGLEETERESSVLVRTALENAHGDLDEAVRELEEAKQALTQRMTGAGA